MYAYIPHLSLYVTRSIKQQPACPSRVFDVDAVPVRLVTL